jgi:hypothetical protein
MGSGSNQRQWELRLIRLNHDFSLIHLIGMIVTAVENR